MNGEFRLIHMPVALVLCLKGMFSYGHVLSTGNRLLYVRSFRLSCSEELSSPIILHSVIDFMLLVILRTRFLSST
jgi:hypothetical protein